METFSLLTNIELPLLQTVIGSQSVYEEVAM
jgi:hypothetical protein